MPKHFRFAHQQESAGDESVLIVGAHVADVWDCVVCGSENEDRAVCAYCSTDRGDWVCGCGHKNKKAADACEECGTGRPEE